METTDIDSLVSLLNKVKGAMAHPEFEVAYEELLENMEDEAPFRYKDVSDATILVYLLDDQSEWIWEEHGKLYSQGASDAYVWKAGEWQDTSQLDDE